MTIDPNADSPSDTEPELEPELKPSKVTRARVTPSGTSTRRRPIAGGEATAATDIPGTTEPTPLRADHVEISQAGVDTVEATTVSITQGGIRTVHADAVDVHQGGIARATAKDIAVSSGSIGYASGERVSVEMGAAGLVRASGEARLTQDAVGFAIGQDVIVDQSFVSTLVAERVTLRQPSAVLLLIARRVDGSVRPLLDWRGALVAGAVAGAVAGLIRWGRR